MRTRIEFHDYKPRLVYDFPENYLSVEVESGDQRQIFFFADIMEWRDFREAIVKHEHYMLFRKGKEGISNPLEADAWCDAFFQQRLLNADLNAPVQVAMHEAAK